MPSKSHLTTWLAFGAVALAGCGGAVRVQPTTPAGSARLASHGRLDSPITFHNHLGCLQNAHLPVRVVSPTRLQIGASPGGPTIVFRSTPGAAQAAQIQGDAEGAEIIGTALIYPNQASDAELARIAACLAQGVQG
jgi:hypothetical protein